MRPLQRLAHVAVVTAVLLAGCGDAAGPGGAAGSGDAAGAGGADAAAGDDPNAARNDLLLENLSSCDRVDVGDDQPAVSADVEGLVLPADAHVLSVSEQGPLTVVDGVVHATPLQVRSELEERTDLTVLSSEDEVFEAELLLQIGDSRVYMLVAALCADASSFSATVGPDSGDAGLPDLGQG